MKWSGLPIVIMGISGISKETKIIIDEINNLNYEKMYNFLGFISEKSEDIGKKVLNSTVVCSDENFADYIEGFKEMGVVIPIGTPKIKKRIFRKLRKYNKIIFPNIISPSAKIMDYDNIKLGIGNIICSGCILTTEIELGNFNLININTTIGHNSVIKDYCVINPLSSISGDVTINDEVLCGAGCTIKQGVNIARNSIIGLGAFVVKDVHENTTIICTPGRNSRKEE